MSKHNRNGPECRWKTLMYAKNDRPWKNNKQFYNYYGRCFQVSTTTRNVLTNDQHQILEK